MNPRQLELPLAPNLWEKMKPAQKNETIKIIVMMIKHITQNESAEDNHGNTKGSKDI